LEKSSWIIKNSSIPSSLKKSNYDKDILKILAGRGISTVEEVESFMNPSLDNLSSPFDFADISIASDKLKSAIETKEKIYIYGDYDVDGITSVSLLFLGLKNLGGNVEFYIPLRDEGYGLNKEAIKKIKDNGCEIMITVDCGISSHNEIAFANELGITVIVTDHHEINSGLPPAFAVINPKRDDNISRFRYLAGVGTAFMLLSALFSKFGRKDEVFQYLDIVAIGTVADIVSLTGDNRILVYFGLKALNSTKNIGLKSLIHSFFGKNPPVIGTSDIGFRIAPAFNAAGRLEHAGKGVLLLTTESEKEADCISLELKAQNDERKEIQKNIFDKVEEKITLENLSSQNAIIAAGKDFHHGVIGIVASKIVDKYYKPAIIMEIKEDGVAVASARSIEGFNIIEALDSMKELFLKYGGHEGAAGFSIKASNIDEFSLRFNNYIEQKISKEIYSKPVKIEKEIIPAKISFEFFSVLSRLEPFGFGNQRPLFCLRDVSLANIRAIGEDKTHIMFDILKEGYVLRNCAWFGKAHHFNTLSSAKLCDVAFKLESSEFKEKFYIKPFIEDVKISTNSYSKLNYLTDLHTLTFPMKTVCYGNVPISMDKNISLNFDTTGNIQVLQNKKIVTFLSQELSKILRDLSAFYNFKFSAEILDIDSRENTSNIYIEISKSFDLSTFSTKDSTIFTEIKEFLINSFDYNSMQKSLLSSFFKDEKNCIVNSQRGRGVKTAFLAIAIYYKIRYNKKSVLISNDDSFISEFLSNYFDIYSSEPSNISDYEFAVYYNLLPVNYKGRGVVFSKEKAEFKDFKYIEDEFKISSSVLILEENSLSEYEKKPVFIYSKHLPITEKTEFKKNMNKYEKIVSDRSILALF
jgi:single-stranded-DNA-specific exonuclease